MAASWPVASDASQPCYDLDRLLWPGTGDNWRIYSYNGVQVGWDGEAAEGRRWPDGRLSFFADFKVGQDAEQGFSVVHLR